MSDISGEKNMCDVPGLTPDQYEVLEFVRVAGQKISSRLVYVPSEKMLYSQNAPCKLGTAFRCRDRGLKCSARRILTSDGRLIKLKKSPNHNHESNYEQEFKNLSAIQSLKEKCSKIETVAGSAKMASVRSIYKTVIEERVDIFLHLLHFAQFSKLLLIFCSNRYSLLIGILLFIFK